MKRSRDAYDATRQWCLDTRVRLALFVPMDNVRRVVRPGLCSVYYCPAPPQAAGTGIMIDGLSFELYALVEETLTNDDLCSSFLYSYLFSEMADKDNKRFPSTPYGDALQLVYSRMDAGILTIDTVPADAHENMGTLHYGPFEESKVFTRRVHITTRSHALFFYLINHYGRDDKIVRNRNDPQRMKTHALLLLCKMRTPGRKPGKGKATVKPSHKFSAMPSLRLVRDYPALEILKEQMRLTIDDLGRLAEHNIQVIVKRAKHQAARLAEAGDLGLRDLDNETDANDPDEASGFVTGASQLYASALEADIVRCSGMLTAGTMRLPRELDGDINIPHVHRAFGSKPWLLENPVPMGEVHQMVNYGALTFQRTMSIGREGSAHTVGQVFKFKTHEDIVRDYKPPPPQVKPTPRDVKKAKSRPKKTKTPIKASPPSPSSSSPLSTNLVSKETSVLSIASLLKLKPTVTRHATATESALLPIKTEH